MAFSVRFGRVLRGRSAFMNGQDDLSNVGLSFYAPFNDLGAGAVNLNLSRGSGSPTFTRATTATTILSNGLIGSVASGTARSCYSPAGVYLGYLAEEARTNLLLQSNSFTITWGNFGGAFTPTQDTVGPDGTVSAWTFTDADVATFVGKTQTITVPADSSAYTYSVYVKQSATNPTVGINCSINGGTSVVVNSRVNVATGVSFNGNLVQTLNTPSGVWYRIINTITNNGTAGNTSLTISIFPATCAQGTSSDNVAITGSNVFWGAQLELGTFATSYIPTTTVAVTRNADSLSYPVAGNFSDTAGTVYIAVNVQGHNSTGSNGLIGSGGSGLLYSQAVASQITTFDGTSSSAVSGLVVGVSGRIGATWSGAGKKVWSGGISDAGTAYDGSYNMANIVLGGVAGAVCLKDAKIWSRTLSDLEMVQITR
jgi:hypothetical protein